MVLFLLNIIMLAFGIWFSLMASSMAVDLVLLKQHPAMAEKKNQIFSAQTEVLQHVCLRLCLSGYVQANCGHKNLCVAPCFHQCVYAVCARRSLRYFGNINLSLMNIISDDGLGRSSQVQRGIAKECKMQVQVNQLLGCFSWRWPGPPQCRSPGGQRNYKLLSR